VDKHSALQPSPSAVEHTASLLKRKTNTGSNGSNPTHKSKYAFTVPAAWRLTRAESKQALHMLFNEFNTNATGHLSFDELTHLLQTISVRGHADLRSPWTKKEVQSVLHAFDSDGNGTVEEEEFVSWIVTGLAKTSQNRQTFAKKSLLGFKLNQFLIAIANVCVQYIESHASMGGRRKLPGNSHSKIMVGNTGLSENELENMLHTIFEQHDTDNSHSIEMDELKILVENGLKQGRMNTSAMGDTGFTGKDYTSLMHAFDTDGDGTVDEMEFVSWIMEGSSKTNLERRQFASSSTLAFKLNNFLTAMIHVCQDLYEKKSHTNIGDSQFNENDIRSALHSLFVEFSSNEGTHLVLLELQKLMQQVNVRMNESHASSPIQLRGSAPIFHTIEATHLTMEEMQEVVDLFDEDQNGLIEERELVNWIVSGIERTDDERAEFALTSAIAAKLDVFLRNVLLYIEQWHSNHDDHHAKRKKHRASRANRRKIIMHTGNNHRNNNDDDDDDDKKGNAEEDDGEEEDEDEYTDSKHIDSWDETFQDLEATYRNENPTAADLAVEMNDLTTTFHQRMKEMETQMHTMHAFHARQKRQSPRSNTVAATTPTSRKERDRINFLESSVVMLCAKLGIQENEIGQHLEGGRRGGSGSGRGSEREKAVPYIQEPVDWSTMKTSRTKTMSSAASRQEKTMRQQPHARRRQHPTKKYTREEEEDGGHILLYHDDSDDSDNDHHIVVYSSDEDLDVEEEEPDYVLEI